MSRKHCSFAAACVIIAATLAVAAYAQGEERELPVLEDEMVLQSLPWWNWNSTTDLGGLAVGTDSRSKAARSYLQWDLSSLDSRRGIGRAKLRACLSGSPYGIDRAIAVHLCRTDGWSASSITWNSAPQPDQAAAAVAEPPFTVGEYYEWDVTDLVRDELAGDKKLSLVLMDSAEGVPPSTFRYFAEAEYNGGATQPVLVVTQEETPADTTPPTITAKCTPDTLWPPNHQYVTVQVDLQVVDDTDPAPTVTVSVTSSEPDDAPGGGDGDTIEDIDQATLTMFDLRAERSSNGTGRTYTIAYTAVDACGNAATKSCTVVVPHDKGDDATVKKGKK